MPSQPKKLSILVHRRPDVNIKTALSLRGHVSPVKSIMDSINIDPLIATLDFWTEHVLEAYWKELVRECTEINNTGLTQEYDTVATTG